MSNPKHLAGSQAPPVPPAEPGADLIRPDDDQLLASAPSEAPPWLENGQALLEPDGRITEVNESFRQWLDRGEGSLGGQSFWRLLAERCPEWRDRLETFRADKATFSEIDLKLATDPAQTAQWFRLERAAHGAGAFVRFHSILPPGPDLEESSWDQQLRHEFARREMFLRLLRAEAQLKSLTERWPGVIFSQRADFSFRFVSPQIEALTGVSVAEWQSKPHLFWSVVHESDAEELRQQLKRARQSGQTITSTYRVRHAQTGRVAYVMEHRQPHVSRGGLLLGYEGVWLDVTRQTIAEKRLSSAAWKETLSVLTMGLAHDFGNVMAGIHAVSESLVDQAGDPAGFNEGLALIKRNARQASQLMHRIINLHQGRTGENNYHNLNEITTDLADLVRKILPRRMALAVELSSEALPVYLDVVELRQVVINLVLNAVEAMPTTGRLVLRTAGFSVLPALENLQGALPRLPAACLSVQDNGCGIKAQHLASIFEAFFTTKPANRSSGLGLYNARLFVEKHRGGITVDTKEGAGSTFHLWLPQADFTEAGAEASGSVNGIVTSESAIPLTDPRKKDF
jgi:PAS domain S-box-containing protein